MAFTRFKRAMWRLIFPPPKPFSIPREFPAKQPVIIEKPRRIGWRTVYNVGLWTFFAGGYVYHTIFKTNSQAKDWQISIYKALPLKMLSRLWGSINEKNLPEFMRAPVYKWYIRRFKVNMDEAAIRDLKHYRNLGELFRRRLSPSCRPVNKESCLVSPSDGKVLHFGRLEEGKLEQVKGVKYSLGQFLGPHSWPSKNNKFTYSSSTECTHSDDSYGYCIQSTQEKALYYCVIYLAPGDYHGFHSPTDWVISMRRHFPGELLSVNPGLARWVRGLFNLNERAVYVGEWAHGFFAMAPVGATNVGSIKVYHDEKLLTNKRGKSKRGFYEDEVFTRKDFGGLPLKKGQSFGEFNLGSSIVLIFEAPETFKFQIKRRQQIKFGEPLGGV